MQNLRSIQVLRGVAACVVVVMHAYASSNDIMDSPLRIGAAGVDLFFVISGFIIASIPKRPSFLFDRVWRVYPVWLVAVTPFFFIRDSGWIEIVSSVTHWPVFHEFILPALPIGWTLSFEVLFYAAVALGLATRPAIPLTIFAACLLGGLLTNAPIFDFLGSPMIFEFLFGVVIARLPRDEWLGAPLIAAALVLLAISPLSVFGAEVATSADAAWVRAIFWGFPCGLVVYGALCLERWFRDGLFTRLGDASFSIYLWHTVVIGSLATPWPVKLAAGIAGGVLMWWLIERPIQNAREPVKAWLRLRSFHVQAAAPTGAPR